MRRATMTAFLERNQKKSRSNQRLKNVRNLLTKKQIKIKKANRSSFKTELKQNRRSRLNNRPKNSIPLGSLSLKPWQRSSDNL
jgi:hypothetical protein